MRRSQRGGTCARCGAAGPAGIYWTGPDTIPVPPDPTVPVLCDRCETDRQYEQWRSITPPPAAPRPPAAADPERED